jgi:hypothetical protein
VYDYLGELEAKNLVSLVGICVVCKLKAPTASNSLRALYHKVEWKPYGFWLVVVVLEYIAAPDLF